MGAENVEMTLPIEMSEWDVLQKFEAIKEDCVYEYGHDPYNGTWSTIETIKFDKKEFDNDDDAQKYCLDKAQKWDYAIAVKVHRKVEDEGEGENRLYIVKLKVGDRSHGKNGLYIVREACDRWVISNNSKGYNYIYEYETEQEAKDKLAQLVKDGLWYWFIGGWAAC